MKYNKKRSNVFEEIPFSANKDIIKHVKECLNFIVVKKNENVENSFPRKSLKRKIYYKFCLIKL